MPEKLSDVCPDAEVVFWGLGSRFLKERPALSVLAMECIASWSAVEDFLLHMYARLMEENSLAFETYLKFDIQTAKSQAILTAAESRLKNHPKKLSVLKAILRIAKTNQKMRDKIAHNTWGICHELPNALLLLDPRARYPKKEPGHIDKSCIYVYREVDFENIIKANDRLCYFGFEFGYVLNDVIIGRPRSIEESDKEGRIFSALLAEPEIQEKLDHQA